MSEQVTIERSTDYPVIANLLRGSPSLTEPPTADKLRKLRRAIFFVAKSRGMPIGVGCIHKWDFFISVLKYLYVQSEYRGHGTAQKIVSLVCDVAVNEFGTPIILATTLADNLPVHAIMVRFMFRPVATFASPKSNRMVAVWLRNFRSASPQTETAQEESLIDG